MRPISSLISLLCLLAVVLGCPFDPTALPSALSCIQNIVCLTTPAADERVLLQNCNKSWYYGTSTVPIHRLNASGPSNPTSFIGNGKKAASIKANSDFALVSFNGTELFYYPLGSQNYTLQVPYLTSFLDYQPLSLGAGQYMAAAITGNTITTVLYDTPNNAITTQTLDLGEGLMKLNCISVEKVCLIGTSDGKVLLYDIENNTLEATFSAQSNDEVVLLQMQKKTNSNIYKTFISFSSGILSEYHLDIPDTSFTLERTSSHFRGETIQSLGHFQNSDYLIVTDKAGNASQIDLTSGILLDSLNISPYLADKTSLGMSLLMNSPDSYFLYNTANSAIFYAQATPDSTKSKVILRCINLHYYNNTMQGCEACSSSCATCQPLTGKCIDCITKYFNTGGECRSCFYDSKGLTDSFEECFSKNEQDLMEKSAAVVQVVSVVVSTFATFLNIFGLLFLFLKLINNWNIICLYFFVPIELPFFLDNVLKMLFSNFNSSVLETLGIPLNCSLSLSSTAPSAKFQLMNLSTDFLAMNAQPIILFVYSVVLITTVYKVVNYLLAKVNITIFEQNTAISIIEEFVGCFTVSFLPFYYVISNQLVRNRGERINYAIHVLFVGVSLLIPFCFLIFDHEYKLIRTSKVHNNDENMIAGSVDLGLTRRIKAWREDDSKERFFYALLSLSTAFLAPNQNPNVFLIGAGLVNLACLINALFSKKQRFHKILQKLSFLAFHICFSLLYYLKESHTKFRISLALVILIIFITAHELILTVYKKIYFVFILIKGKLEKEERIRLFFQQTQHKLTKSNRVHPIALPLATNNQQILEYQMHFSFKNFQLKVVRSNEKELQSPKLKKAVSRKKKETRSEKKVVGEGSKGKGVTFLVKQELDGQAGGFGVSRKIKLK